MPRTKFDVRPQVDWFIAAILWRKATQGLSWEDIASRIGVNPHTLRNWCFTKPSGEWQVYALKKTLKELDLDYREISDLMEDR